MFRHDRDVIQVVFKLLVQRIIKGHLNGQIIHFDNIRQVTPHIREPDPGILLTQFKGEDHIISVQDFPVGPG